MTGEGLQAQLGGLRLNLPITLLATIVGAIFTAGVFYTQIGNWQQTNKDRNDQLTNRIIEIKNDIASLDGRMNRLNERLDRDWDKAREDRASLAGSIAGLTSDMRNVNSQVQFMLQRMSPSSSNQDGWGENRKRAPPP